MKIKIKNIIVFLLLLISSIAIIGSIYYIKEFPRQDFDIIIYTLSTGVEHSSSDVINSILLKCSIPLILLFSLLILPTIKKTKKPITFKFHFKGNEKTAQLFPIRKTSDHRAIYVAVVFIVALIIAIKCFRIDAFIKNRFQTTQIFEEYYVDAKSVNIKFPEKKRNLIIIVGESFENTVLSKENGGAWEYSIMPELEHLALANLSFSNNEKIGGPFHTHGTDYSAGGNVAITAGIPLKTVDMLLDKNNYTGNGKYLENVYTLGEILKDNGYNLEIIMGSDSTFGGRKQYYETNGDYKIFDVNYAISQGKMSKEDAVWWGFDDDDLFDWSKEELKNLAKDNKPFNYIILTADTHFMDGYLGPNVEDKFDTQYENVHAYSSKCVNDFVNWIKKQDFYEDTTIVILGDHLGMQNEFYEERIEKNINNDYTRTIYNVIINSDVKTANNKNRLFTTLDMFPTMLASIGAEIEGDRLGLGTNLFSEKPTLVEELGYDYFNNELKKNSKFYNETILGEDYYIMRKSNSQESENVYE